MDDPFGTAALRAAVLDAWAASPHRFREDANAEEWLSLGYAGRVIAELAANGADAAGAAGVPGRIAIRFGGGARDGALLCVANTGAPLTAAGVAALASLRASAKRPEPAVGVAPQDSPDDGPAAGTAGRGAPRDDAAGASGRRESAAAAGPGGGAAEASDAEGVSRETPVSVGHFGVGFTAVRAISDEITVVSATGSVRFSVTETAAAVRSIGDDALRTEVERRGGQLPALRLPWPVPGLAPPDGYVTEVRLRLRDGIDIGALASTLTADLAADLLWALPGLTTVTLPGCTLQRREDPAEPGLVALVRIDDGPSGDGGPGAAASDDAARPDAVRDAREAAAASAGHARTPTVDSAGAALAWDGSDSLGALVAGGRGDLTVPGVVDYDGSPVTGPTAAQRFRVHRAAGELPAALLAERPVEERGRTGWFVTWIVPLDEDGAPVPARQTEVGAPTPTADKIGLPARLVASLPVDDARSHVADGPLTDYVAARAAEAYSDLLRDLPADQRWVLLPAPGFPLGEFDGLLRERLTAELSAADILPGAGGRLVVPADAVMIPGLAGPAAAAAAEALPDLVPWPPAVAQVEALRSLGARIGALDEALNAVAMLDRPVGFYRPLYDALAEVPADDLAGLPVPRAGGGTLIGARGVLLDASAEKRTWAERAAQSVPGIRLAAHGLDHPLLRRLGARELDAETLLAAPELAREIDRRHDDFDAGFDAEPGDEPPVGADDFAELVLDLVRQGGPPPQGRPVDLRRLLLTDADGERCPAGDLLMPEAPLRAVLADDVELPTVGARWVERYGSDVLETVGVRTTFAVARYALPPGDDADLDDVDAWWEGAAAGESGVGAAPDEGQEFTAVTDLDLVADDAWPQALTMIAASAPAREALRHTAFGPSYSAWWLRRYAVLDGCPPRHWRTVDAAELTGLYDALPAGLAGGLPDDLQAEIGVLRTLADAAADPAELLSRWADAGRVLPAVRVPAVTAAVIDALARAAGREIPLPATVRTLGGGVIDADDALVLDRPMLAQVLDPGTLVAGGSDPALAAELLDLPLASEEDRWAVVDSASVATTLGELPGALRCLDWLGRSDLADQRVRLVTELTVRATDATERRVTWWIADDGAPHLDGSAHGIARVTATLTSRWAERYVLQAIAGGAATDLAELGVDGEPGHHRQPVPPPGY